MLKETYTKNVHMPVTCHCIGINRIEAGIPFCIFWWKNQVCEVKNTTSGSNLNYFFYMPLGRQRKITLMDIFRIPRISSYHATLNTRRNKYQLMTSSCD